MKRAFKFAPRPAKQVDYTPRPRAVARADVTGRLYVTPIAKPEPVRDEAYRRLVAALPCACCGIDGYSQAAHANTGKGMGTKASDADCFPLCGPRPGRIGCHEMFDSGGMFDKEQRRAREVYWIAHTRATLLALAESDPAARRIVLRALKGIV